MNKKGFTLIELLMSVALLSIVLVFMMNTLIKLRDTSLADGVKTNLLVGQAIITKTINSDVLEHNGIKSLTCTDKSATLTLTDNSVRTITINEATSNVSANTLLIYEDEDQNIMTRKAPTNYKYGTITCDQSFTNLIKIEISITDNSNNELEEYNSEVIYYNN